MTETLRAIDALLARRPTTPPPLATALAEEDEEEEGAESVDGTLSQLLHAEAAEAEAEAEAEEAEAVAVAEVEAEAVQPVASAPSVGRGFTRTEAPNTAPSTAPSSGEAACARLLGELGELQSPALGELQSPAIELQSPALGELQSPVLELQSPALELQSPALELGEVAIRGAPGEGSSAQYGASVMRSAVMSAVEEDELVYQGGGASQASQGGGASQGSQGSRERGVARFGIGLSVEGAVEGAEDEAPASLRQLRQLRQLGAEDEAIGERAGALGSAGALGGEDGEDGEGAAGPSLADSYADETLDDEAHEWRETLELLIPALPRLPPEQVSLVNRLIKTPSQD